MEKEKKKTDRNKEARLRNKIVYNYLMEKELYGEF